MTKHQPLRFVLRPELLPNAKKIQRVCGLESWGAAVNMVFALYGGHLIERLSCNPGEMTTIITATERSRVQEVRSPSPSVSPPGQIETSQQAESLGLRDFLRQARVTA